MTARIKKIHTAFIDLYWSAFDDGRVAAFGKTKGRTNIVKILKDRGLQERRASIIMSAMRKTLSKSDYEAIQKMIAKAKGKT